MALNSISQVLTGLEAQYQSPERQQLQRLLQCWVEAVGPAAATQTQPLAVQRGVLRVATSSAAWAQNLMFDRRRILEKLNPHLPTPLTDIRFSTAQWQDRKAIVSSFGSEQQTQLWQAHPSRLAAVPQPRSTEFSDPTQAFQQWAASVQSRMQDLPLCPECQCPTPAGELDRWSVCAHCAAKQW
ncbi:DUF721 domain-containing protein [Leptolyngbya sp. FACHB-36]|uniref:DUF721 domain-containing protein n=1 Tax=Leptolyngbya sp. FACHB-36 TaxID=2692808 RepID=UPI00167FE989|nr:DciA family protein [Leptolyngbya sp. FACHB-36]MBD2022135.1 DUF721 domain-containing protein [Leptolyngbya sp. FACHB-36]